MQATGRRRTEVDQRRKQVTRPRMPLQHTMLFPKNTSVDRMGHTIPLTAGRVGEKGGREQTFSGRGEGHVDRIVHTPGHHGFQLRMVWSTAKHMRRSRAPAWLTDKVVRLLGKRSLGELDPTIGSEVGTMKIISAAGKRASVVPHLAEIREAITVGVGELEDLWSRRDIQ